MQDCLIGTGAEPGPMVAIAIVAAILVVAGITVLLARGKGRGATLLVAVLLLGGASAAVAPAAPASAADCPKTPPTATPAFVIDGIWAGTALPWWLPDGYFLIADITDDGTTASAVVDYPGGCTSTWAQTARTATTVTFLETITTMAFPGACVDQGIVTITPAGAPPTELDWWYEYAGGPTEYDHGATLTPYTPSPAP